MNQLEDMIEKYQNLVFSICYRTTGNYFDAQDLAQETFLSAFRNLSEFDGKNEKAWIAKIATNKSLDYLKHSARRTVATEDNFFTMMQAKDAGPEGSAIEADIRERLLDHCISLSPPYGEIARLYFYEEMTVTEIATLLNRSEKTVWTQVYRTKAMLRKLYEKEGIQCST